MTVAQRMKEKRKELGFSAEYIAEKLNVSAATVYRYENGDIEKMPVDTLGPLAKALLTTPAYLMGWDDEEKLSSIVPFPKSTQLWAEPILNAYAAAIQPTQEAACAVLGIAHVIPETGYETPLGEEMESVLTFAYPSAAGIPLYVEGDFEQIDFPKSSIPAGTDFAIRIDGDSMEPTIQDGSYVFIHKQQDLQNGQIGIFMIDDSATCKRFYEKDNAVILKSDNPAYKDIEIGEYQTFYVVGRVLGHR